MIETLEEYYEIYRNNPNPITGEKRLLKDITDKMIWEIAYTAGYNKAIDKIKNGEMDLF
jgi:hypothetical protein